MKTALVYNLRKEETEDTAELLKSEDVERIFSAIEKTGHEVELIEASGQPSGLVKRLEEASPDLVFNVAEGTEGEAREAFYPSLYEQMNIPYTGGNPSLLFINLNKQLSKIILEEHGITTPKGAVITNEEQKLPPEIEFPIILKPNSEGSSKGISPDSIAENKEQYKEKIGRMLKRFPSGMLAEQYIDGKEISVPVLEAAPGKILDIVEYDINREKTGNKYNIYDYDTKQSSAKGAVKVICPAKLSGEEKSMILSLTEKVVEVTECPDFGRVDIRMNRKGVPYFIELNPLPSLHPKAALMTAAKVKGVDYDEVIRLVIRSAVRRYGIAVDKVKVTGKVDMLTRGKRPGPRALGITTGRFKTGLYNNITDVKDVKIGQVTNNRDDVEFPGGKTKGSVRSGITVIMPAGGDIMNEKLSAGGFVLNGIGEMAGFHQVIEWGWLESPIFLTNTISLGRVHQAAVDFMMDKYPIAGAGTRAVLPVVGETDDSFLNDIRIPSITEKNVYDAVQNAKDGPFEQGSVGAGTGMITMDFAGGIGSSSRVIKVGQKEYTIGVLVLSNFGRMKNLTMDGAIVGRELDKIYPYEIRRQNSYGSIIAVVATDAPLLSTQLTRVSKRAALGFGRTGSHAASTSGEIVVAFSTRSRLDVDDEKREKVLEVESMGDTHISDVYEATIEATEEAILNAIFKSSGMKGREGRIAPAIPQGRVIEILNEGRHIDEGG